MQKFVASANSWGASSEQIRLVRPMWESFSTMINSFIFPKMFRSSYTCFMILCGRDKRAGGASAFKADIDAHSVQAILGGTPVHVGLLLGEMKFAMLLRLSIGAWLVLLIPSRRTSILNACPRCFCNFESLSLFIQCSKVLFYVSSETPICKVFIMLLGGFAKPSSFLFNRCWRKGSCRSESCNRGSWGKNWGNMQWMQWMHWCTWWDSDLYAPMHFSSNVVRDSGNYWCQKGFYAVYVQAKKQCLWCSTSNKGCTKDIRASWSPNCLTYQPILWKSCKSSVNTLQVTVLCPCSAFC